MVLLINIAFEVAEYYLRSNLLCLNKTGMRHDVTDILLF